MPGKELNPLNYRRIAWINWVLSPPLVVLFAWPYAYLAGVLGVPAPAAWIGSVLFALPFMITILHGHVTMALGSAHRHYYYEWLRKRPLGYGLLFHPIVIRTRFRLLLAYASLAVLLAGAAWPAG